MSIESQLNKEIIDQLEAMDCAPYKFSKLLSAIELFQDNNSALITIGIFKSDNDEYEINLDILSNYWGHFGKQSTKGSVSKHSLQKIFKKLKLKSETETKTKTKTKTKYVFTIQKLHELINKKEIKDFLKKFLDKEKIELYKANQSSINILISYKEFEQYNKANSLKANSNSISKYLSNGDKMIEWAITEYIDFHYYQSSFECVKAFFDIMSKFGPKEKIVQNIRSLFKKPYELYEWIPFKKNKKLTIPIIRPSFYPFKFKIEYPLGGEQYIERDLENNTFIVKNKDSDKVQIYNSLKEAYEAETNELIMDGDDSKYTLWFLE